MSGSYMCVDTRFRKRFILHDIHISNRAFLPGTTNATNNSVLVMGTWQMAYDFEKPCRSIWKQKSRLSKHDASASVQRRTLQSVQRLVQEQTKTAAVPQRK